MRNIKYNSFEDSDETWKEIDDILEKSQLENDQDQSDVHNFFPVYHSLENKEFSDDEEPVIIHNDDEEQEPVILPNDDEEQEPVILPNDPDYEATDDPIIFHFPGDDKPEIKELSPSVAKTVGKVNYLFEK